MFDRRTLPLNGLRAFESAARHLHYQKAGEELGVTQSAISHQIRGLEEALDTRLFDRAHNRLSLTPAGKQLLSSASSAFEQLIEGTRDLAPDTLSGTLTLGSTASLMVSLLTRVIAQFRERYPEIDLEVVEIKPMQREIPRNVDLALCFGRPLTENRRVEILLEQQLFPVCSPRLLHGGKRIKSPADILNMPLLHNDLGYWGYWFDAVGLADARAEQNLHFFNTHLSLFAARRGLGVALATALEVDDDLRDGVLLKLLDRTVPETSHYHLVAHHDEEQTLRARLFEALLKESIANIHQQRG